MLLVQKSAGLAALLLLRLRLLRDRRGSLILLFLAFRLKIAGILTQELELLDETEHHRRSLRSLQDALLHHLRHARHFRNLIIDDEGVLRARLRRELNNRNLRTIVGVLEKASGERGAQLVLRITLLDEKLEHTILRRILHLALEQHKTAVQLLVAALGDALDGLLPRLARRILTEADELGVTIVRETLATRALRRLIGADLTVIAAANDDLVAVVDLRFIEALKNVQDVIGEARPIEVRPHLFDGVVSDGKNRLIRKHDGLAAGARHRARRLEALVERRRADLVVGILFLRGNPRRIVGSCRHLLAVLCPM